MSEQPTDWSRSSFLHFSNKMFWGLWLSRDNQDDLEPSKCKTIWLKCGLAISTRVKSVWAANRFESVLSSSLKLWLITSSLQSWGYYDDFKAVNINTPWFSSPSKAESILGANSNFQVLCFWFFRTNQDDLAACNCTMIRLKSGLAISNGAKSFWAANRLESVPSSSLKLLLIKWFLYFLLIETI